MENLPGINNWLVYLLIRQKLGIIDLIILFKCNLEQHFLIVEDSQNSFWAILKWILY